MNERFEPWEPIDTCDGEFSIVWFEHRPASGVVLEVERMGGGPVLRVWFDYPIAFRMHPHDILMETWWESHSFYRVRESSWASLLQGKSQGIWVGSYTHYGCKTVDGCYEVLSANEPRAEWVAPKMSLNSILRASSIGEPE